MLNSLNTGNVGIRNQGTVDFDLFDQRERVLLHNFEEFFQEWFVRMTSELFTSGANLPTVHLDTSHDRQARAGGEVVVQKPQHCLRHWFSAVRTLFNARPVGASPTRLAAARRRVFFSSVFLSSLSARIRHSSVWPCARPPLISALQTKQRSHVPCAMKSLCLRYSLLVTGS